MMTKTAIISLIIFAAMTPIALKADMIDANTPVLCATIDVNDCAPGERCITGVPEEASIPRFFRIDFTKKKIKVTRDDGTTLDTLIKNQNKLEDKIVLQGTEAGLGWTMAIMSASGKMSLVAAGEQRGVVIFGACTAL